MVTSEVTTYYDDGVMPRFPAVQRLFTDALGDPPPKGAAKRIADAVGVTQGTLSRWVSGQTGIDSAYWPKLAAALEVSETDIRAAVLVNSHATPVNGGAGEPTNSDLAAKLDENTALLRELVGITKRRYAADVALRDQTPKSTRRPNQL